jgi:hypothetical protein
MKNFGIRLKLEKCDNPEGFVVFNSSSSATGSGVAAFLHEDMGKLECMHQTIWPDQSRRSSQGPMATYNFISLLGELQD